MEGCAALSELSIPEFLTFSALRTHAVVAVVSRDGNKATQALLDVRSFLRSGEVGEIIDVATMSPTSAEDLCRVVGRSCKSDPARKLLTPVNRGGVLKWWSLHRISRELAAREAEEGPGMSSVCTGTPRVSSLASLASAGASTASLLSLAGAEEEEYDEEEAARIALARSWAENLREASNMAGVDVDEDSEVYGSGSSYQSNGGRIGSAST